MTGELAIGAGSGTALNRIVFVGHSTVLIECDGARLLTDPVLRSRLAHLRRQVPPPSPIAGESIDAVLISHLHHDHLDLPSLRALGRGVPVLVPVGAGSWLEQRGFAGVRELGLEAVADVGALAVTAVEARHEGRRAGGPRAQAVGFLVSGSRTIYFAGDTEVFPAMAGIAARLDVALLPVSGWGPGLGAGHMGPLEAARAASLLNPSVAIPIHWGTLAPIGLGRRLRAQLRDAPGLFAEHVARLAPGVEVRVLAPGEATSL